MSQAPKGMPRYIPTLTEVVQGPRPNSDNGVLPAPPFDSVAFEEQLIHKVLQRVDVLLEARLQKAVQRVVEEQTRSLLPRLSEEIEAEVRSVVSESVANELVRT